MVSRDSIDQACLDAGGVFTLQTDNRYPGLSGARRKWVDTAYSRFTVHRVAEGAGQFACPAARTEIWNNHEPLIHSLLLPIPLRQFTQGQGQLAAMRLMVVLKVIFRNVTLPGQMFCKL